VWQRPLPQAELPVRAGGRQAGRARAEDRSRSGKEHLLQVYVRAGDLDKTEHAMNSLIASVAWDEARFGLPLDLERFMIVAVSDFNMGAMENKGLNLFNTKFVLASPATATDADFHNIESVVGHE
jgi:aminopeptidase N